MKKMSKIKIEKNIPIPEKPCNSYPVKDLKPGDSFLVPGKDRKNLVRVSAFLSRFRKKPEAKGKSYTCRKVSDGIRVWRLK